MISDVQLEELKSAFASIEISGVVENYFRENWQTVSFKKNEFLTEAGNYEKYLYFVLDGVQALYLIDSRGEKVVLGFSYRGNISGVYDSLALGEPSSYFLEALTDSTLLRIERGRFLNLFDQFPEFDRWGRIFIGMIAYGRGKREVELLTKTAEERFRSFMSRFPQELSTIPQKYLASYLNMKPETFSRLRANIKD